MGSEMCIRDSRRVAPRLPRPSTARAPMPVSRRRFLAASGAAAALAPFLDAAAQVPDSTAAPVVPFDPTSTSTRSPELPVEVVPAPPSPYPGLPARVMPPRLREGDAVGLVTPAGAIYDPAEVREAEDAIRRLGLRPVRGRYVLERRGYLGGTDLQRATDLMDMVRNDDVRAIVALRGGWGCARILPYLDYNVLRASPKIVCGYSDITGLLLGLYARAGLAGFHGPVGTSTWDAFSTSYFRRVLFDASPVIMPTPTPDELWTLTPGRTSGRLVGGNLSVLSALVGTPYFPDVSGHILFLEEVGEEPYRIDRMLTQLHLAGVFERVRGVVFGSCRNCSAETGYVSLSLRQVMEDHFRVYGFPMFYGTAIGHITAKFTVPVGIEAEMDAEAGLLRLLEPAVA